MTQKIQIINIHIITIFHAGHHQIKNPGQSILQEKF